MDIQLYEQVMHRIKGRIDYVNSIYSHAESLSSVSIFMVESICLQLRTTIEDVAVACIIANSSEEPVLAQKLRKVYRPKQILKELNEINPACYPIPLVENENGSIGKYRDTYDRPKGDWLTQEEAISEYGKLSNIIHQNLINYTDLPTNILEEYKHTQILTTKICNLLSHHQITVLDENKMYRVLMSTKEHGTVQVAEFQRIDDLLGSVDILS